MIDDPQENFNVAGESAYAEVGVHGKKGKFQLWKYAEVGWMERKKNFVSFKNFFFFQMVAELSQMLRAGWREALPPAV